MDIAMHIGSASQAQDVANLLSAHDVTCNRFNSAADLIRASHYGRFDLVVLEVDVGDEEILAWVRGRPSDATPVILLFSHRACDEIVHALEAGADDVLARPFVAGEVAARVRAVLRRVRRSGCMASRVEVAGFVLDRVASQIYDRGLPVDLTPREFAIAWVLFTNPCSFASRDAITRAVWGQDSDVAGRTLEQHIHRLRKKLGLGERRGVLLQAAYGRGYRLDLRSGNPTLSVTAIDAVPSLPVAGRWGADSAAPMLVAS